MLVLGAVGLFTAGMWRAMRKRWALQEALQEALQATIARSVPAVDGLQVQALDFDGLAFDRDPRVHVGGADLPGFARFGPWSERRLDGDQFRSGDAGFDGAVSVTTDERLRTLAALDAPTRAAIRAAVALGAVYDDSGWTVQQPVWSAGVGDRHERALNAATATAHALAGAATALKAAAERLEATALDRCLLENIERGDHRGYRQACLAALERLDSPLVGEARDALGDRPDPPADAEASDAEALSMAVERASTAAIRAPDDTVSEGTPAEEAPEVDYAETAVRCVWGAFVGLFLGLMGGAMLGPAGFWLGLGVGIAVGLRAGSLQYRILVEEARPVTPWPRVLADGILQLLEDARVDGVQAIGRHNGQSVKVWDERGNGASERHIHCVIKPASGDEYLADVAPADLDGPPYDGPGQISVRRDGIRALWARPGSPTPDEGQRWVSDILTQADRRRIPAGTRTEALVALAERGRPSAFEALLREAPSDPRLPDIARRMVEGPLPAGRLAGARWLGAAALEGLVDDVAFGSRWRAKALEARAEVGELPADAIARWAGTPALRLELLIDRMRRGPIAEVQGLVDGMAPWGEVDEARPEALADAIIARGAEVEGAARRLFEGGAGGRAQLARALGEIGEVPSLMTLRAAQIAYAADDPAVEDAVERAIAQLTHRLGDAAVGRLALDPSVGEAGGLSLQDPAAGGMSVAPTQGE